MTHIYVSIILASQTNDAMCAHVVHVSENKQLVVVYKILNICNMDYRLHETLKY